MKLLAKITLVVAIAGAGATIYGQPAGVGGVGLDAVTARAATIRSSAQADYRHVLQLQVAARRAKDVIRLNCVNDKLVQIKAEMNVEDHLQLDLQVSRDTSDPTGTLQSLIQTGDTIRGLREAADQCVGEHLLVNESANDYAHPNLPDNPGVDTWGGNAIEPPAYASPVN